jgi:UDP-N-acetylglucosamine 2-epimerase (hydrolysing)
MKKVLFLTGTRADFGKIKSLIQILEQSSDFEPYLFVTGMHLQKLYGYTLLEVQRSGFSHVHTFENSTHETTMDLTLAKTIEGLSAYVKECNPDMIVVHGDRVEALAGAIVGSLNNILVAHIEGGEVSGTIDELIRHSTSKMSHIHFVANELAQLRLVQMGEIQESIFVIGSPDVDVMFSTTLPSLEIVHQHYQIPFEAQDYAMLMFHPVTTEYDTMKAAIKNLADSILEDKGNYIVIYPNNDLGSHFILEEFERFKSIPSIRMFPSIRFEYFLVLLKNSAFMIGNSSAGLREAPYYGIPSINIGTRQNNRALNEEIINCGYAMHEVQEAIRFARNAERYEPKALFGTGKSDQAFYEILSTQDFWRIKTQKSFKDIL